MPRPAPNPKTPSPEEGSLAQRGLSPPAAAGHDMLRRELMSFDDISGRFAGICVPVCAAHSADGGQKEAAPLRPSAVEGQSDWQEKPNSPSALAEKGDDVYAPGRSVSPSAIIAVVPIVWLAAAAVQLAPWHSPLHRPALHDALKQRRSLVPFLLLLQKPLG